MARKVVVAGGGFAGFRVAKALAGGCDVTLVAPSGHFVYVPLIPEVASGNLLVRDVALPLARLLPRTRLLRGLASAVEGSELVLASGERLPFEACVVAVGAEPNDFGVPGVRENALPFQTLEDALRAQGAVTLAASSGAARVVIAGASFTGVEVAGEVGELGERLGADVSITLLDALPDIFPAQTPRFRARVREELDRRGMTLRTSSRIVEVRPAEVFVEGGPPVPSDVTFWCAGIRARRIAGVDPRVRPTLQSAQRDDVFVVGDAAEFPREQAVPKLAQTAEDQAGVCAWNVLHPEAMRAYEPSIRGIVVSIGHHHAVAELAGGRVLAGDLPWHVKRMLYKAKMALA